MGKTPAMLLYLNGAESTAENPNENYARELFELFTLGEDNGYTQQDIEEAARAFTGWGVELSANSVFDFQNWDFGEKTVFGQTGVWNFTDVHNILFEQRGNQIAQHVCNEIYRYFVSEKGNDDVVQEMAQVFLDNNFEIAPMFRQLFSSEHFFDEEIIGTRIKSPWELEISSV